VYHMYCLESFQKYFLYLYKHMDILVSHFNEISVFLEFKLTRLEILHVLAFHSSFLGCRYRMLMGTEIRITVRT
jgi:hypothetical protein